MALRSLCSWFGRDRMATSRDENLLNEKGARPGDQTDESIRDTVDSDLCIDVEAATVDAARHKDEHYDGTRQIVDFDGPHDPADPLHWPAAKKLSIVLNIAWLSAGGQMASSMIAPSVEQIIMEFHTTDLLLAVLIVSVFLIGMAVGLLLTSGLSEVYGRVPVTHATNVGFVVFGCAAAVSQSLGQLIGFRFLQGLMAATPPAVGGGVIGDLYKPKDRGRATSIYGLGMLLGPIIGPVAGGYVTQTIGWRWNCWIIALVGTVNLLVTLLILRETYRPLILDRKVKHLRKETANPYLTAALPHDQSSGLLALRGSFIRPIRLLLTSPLVFLPALILAVIFGLMFLMLSTLSTVYQIVYGWDTGASGLAYLGLGIGLLLGLGIYSATADRVYRRLTQTHTPTPEMRLAPITLGAPLAAIGLLIYGWSLAKALHWMLPIVGCVVFCLGMVAVIMPVTTYLIDAFPNKAAGPVGAASVLRCLAGGLLPLCADELYLGRLGYGWGCTTLAIIALLFAPFPWLFYRNGERLRKRFPIKD